MINDKTLEKFKYWSEEELRSPDAIDSWRLVDYYFLQQLTKLRGIYCKPIYPNSVFRTKLHNAAVGGVSNSTHLLGLAADLAIPKGDHQATLEQLSECKNSRERWNKVSENKVATTSLIQAALDAGFNRLGLGRTFLHVDSDPNKDKNVIWVYS